MLAKRSDIGGIIGHPSRLELVEDIAVTPSNSTGTDTGIGTSITSTMHGKMNVVSGVCSA